MERRHRRGLRIVFDRELNALGHLGSRNIRSEGEGKVYAGGDAGTGYDSSGRDHAFFGWLGAVNPW